MCSICGNHYHASYSDDVTSNGLQHRHLGAVHAGEQPTAVHLLLIFLCSVVNKRRRRSPGGIKTSFANGKISRSRHAIWAVTHPESTPTYLHLQMPLQSRFLQLSPMQTFAKCLKVSPVSPLRISPSSRRAISTSQIRSKRLWLHDRRRPMG